MQFVDRRVTTQIFGNTKKYKNDRHQNQDDKQNGRVDKNNPSDTKKMQYPIHAQKAVAITGKQGSSSLLSTHHRGALNGEGRGCVYFV